MIYFIRYLHYLIEIFYSTYVFIFPPKYDIYFVFFIFLMSFHWIFLKHECILSVIEKKLENSNYVIGSTPKRHIYRDKCPQFIFYITAVLLFVNLLIVYKRSYNSNIIRFLIITSVIIIIYYKLILKLENINNNIQ